MADDDESTSDSSSGENEPAPAGESSSESDTEKEPAPAGEGSDEDKPLEDPDAVSDSSAETDSGSSSDDSSSSSGKRGKGSSSDSSDSSESSSDDSSSGGQSVPPPSEDDVAGALAKAMQDHDVPVDDDGVKVTLSEHGMYNLMVRLGAEVRPLPQIPDDTSNLAPGSVEGARYLLQGAVQIVGDEVRVTMRVVSVETSQILEQSKADGSGSTLDAIQGAAGDCLAGLPSLQAR